MKISEIVKILKQETNSMFDKNWYRKTAEKITNLSPMKIGSVENFINNEIDKVVFEKLKEMPLYTKIYPTDFYELVNLKHHHQRRITGRVFHVCQANGLKLHQGKTNGTRWFSILSLK